MEGPLDEPDQTEQSVQELDTERQVSVCPTLYTRTCLSRWQAFMLYTHFEVWSPTIKAAAVPPLSQCKAYASRPAILLASSCRRAQC